MILQCRTGSASETKALNDKYLMLDPFGLVLAKCKCATFECIFFPFHLQWYCSIPSGYTAPAGVSEGEQQCCEVGGACLGGVLQVSQ